MNTMEVLQETLKDNVVTVTFTKANGEERVMRCTLIESYIQEKGRGVRKINADVISVWDLEKNGWRSFRKDSVKTYEVQ